ncbi:MAG: dihydrofolate reductase family protein [Chloroflexi bacterium]|nr:dihydrofolate reductase family protein [Chloroflexota bacterium]
MQQLVPVYRPVAVEAVYADLTFPKPPPDRPYIAINMVSTVDGKAAIGGSAVGLGSRVDRALMRQVRSAVDALLVGATTVRTELVDPRVPPALVAVRGAHGLPSQPLAVTLSRTLDLDPRRRFLVGGAERTLILTTEQAPLEREQTLRHYARIVRIGAERVDLRAALGWLRHAAGVRWLLCEGGPSVNQALLEAGTLDEVFWTISPTLAGGHGPTLVEGTMPAGNARVRLVPVSLFQHDAEIFARYRVVRPTSAPPPSENSA